MNNPSTPCADDLATCLSCGGELSVENIDNPVDLDGHCDFCIDAFECEDAPWELAVTLGDINVDDEPLHGEWDDGCLALGPYYEPD